MPVGRGTLSCLPEGISGFGERFLGTGESWTLLLTCQGGSDLKQVVPQKLVFKPTI